MLDASAWPLHTNKWSGHSRICSQNVDCVADRQSQPSSAVPCRGLILISITIHFQYFHHLSVALLEANCQRKPTRGRLLPAQADVNAGQSNEPIHSGYQVALVPRSSCAWACFWAVKPYARGHPACSGASCAAKGPKSSTWIDCVPLPQLNLMLQSHLYLAPSL